MPESVDDALVDDALVDDALVDDTRWGHAVGGALSVAVENQR